MRFTVGSLNDTKVNAVKNQLKLSALFADAEVVAAEAKVEEFGHPKSLHETIQGAKQRAYSVYSDTDYSVGLESGLIESVDAKSGYFEITACVIYDGNNYHIGLAPAYEWPKEVMTLILDGKDGSQAFKKAGLTTHEKIGTAEGAIHILTHGKMNRTELNGIAVMMALIHLENPEQYA